MPDPLDLSERIVKLRVKQETEKAAAKQEADVEALLVSLPCFHQLPNERIAHSVKVSPVVIEIGRASCRERG